MMGADFLILRQRPEVILAAERCCDTLQMFHNQNHESHLDWDLRRATGLPTVAALAEVGRGARPSSSESDS